MAARIANGEFAGGTFIDGTKIYSPEICTNDFSIVPKEVGGENRGFSLYAYFGHNLYNMLHIYYLADVPPNVVFCNESGGDINFGSHVNFLSTVDYSSNSDRRMKNSIEYNIDKYEQFFMALKPTQFRYNRGRSERYHVGFIAQDVEEALNCSGLTTKDFAGLVIAPVEKEDPRDGINDVYYRLRYSEFISLNTHMIQKLCKRIEELESKLNSMN